MEDLAVGTCNIRVGNCVGHDAPDKVCCGRDTIHEGPKLWQVNYRNPDSALMVSTFPNFRQELTPLDWHSPAEQDTQHPEKTGQYACNFGKINPENGKVGKRARK